jgi:hypothetical protein
LPYPQLTNIDAIAWEKAGGGPSSYTWQQDDRAKLTVDNVILGGYGHMFYIFALASAAYWIVVVGLLFASKQKQDAK